MKKLSILFLSVLALGITATSCDDKEDSKASIEGKWTFSTIQTLDASNNPTGEATIYAGITNPTTAPCGKYDSMTFKAATPTPNAVYTDYDSDCNPTETPFTYAVNGTTLSLNFGGANPVTGEIMSLTATDLKLKVDVNGTKYQLVLKK